MNEQQSSSASKPSSFSNFAHQHKYVSIALGAATIAFGGLVIAYIRFKQKQRRFNDYDAAEKADSVPPLRGASDSNESAPVAAINAAGRQIVRRTKSVFSHISDFNNFVYGLLDPHSRRPPKPATPRIRTPVTPSLVSSVPASPVTSTPLFLPPLRLSDDSELKQSLLTRSLSMHSLQLLTTIFRQLDTDGDGYITSHEAAQYYAKVRKTIEHEQNAAMMMAEFDKDGDSLISFDEWASTFKSIQCPNETLESALERFGFGNEGQNSVPR